MVEAVIPKIECVASSENYGRFIVEPLESGLGTTLGNSLRRVLLSSLQGAAITSVKIEGVEHEFSTIPYVKEDTIEFLLNVREIRLRPLSGRSGKLMLEVAGEGRVCTGDIIPSADFEIVNPELHLATLDSADARLNVEFNVELGKGYVPAGHSDGLPIGVIPMDAIFTPIRKVSYDVEHTRVGQVTDYDRLIIEIGTDGTISAMEALSQSAEILMKQFSYFSELSEVSRKAAGKEPIGISISTERYDTPIGELGVSVRTLNCLKRYGITKVGEVLEMDEEELLRSVRNFGRKSLEELKERLEALGFIAPPKEKEEGESTEEEAVAEQGAEAMAELQIEEGAEVGLQIEGEPQQAVERVTEEAEGEAMEAKGSENADLRGGVRQ